MGKRRRISLEAKITLLTLGMLFVVLLGVGHIVITNQKQTLYEAKIQQFDNVAQALALSAEPLINKRDSQLSHMIGQRLRDSQWELSYIVISDHTGKKLFSASTGAASYRRPEMRWHALRTVLGYSGLYVSSTHKVKVPVRLGDKRWGIVQAGFSLHKLQDSLHDLESRILYMFAASMLAGLFFAMLFARNMSASLRSLIRGAKAVSRGDFSYRVINRSGDEIGDLADAYNYMLEALSRSHDQLVEKANTDSLTGLYNHRCFQERFSEEFARASRYDHPLSLLMIDIDRFKAFNDEHGHPLGDVVLCDVAAILVESLRESDTSARYGGEEFVVMLPETAGDEALAIAERLRQSVEKHRFYGASGQIVPVTISLGLATYPDHAVEREKLLKAADLALYKAKSEGRNTVCRYCQEEMSSAPVADPYKLYVLLHANDLPTIEALAGAVDAKNRLPIGYSVSVATMASELSKEMRLSDEQRAAVYLASLLRDVGQIAIPDSILSKAEALNDYEKSIIRQHPVLGHSIIQKSSHLQSVLPAVLHHHERFDGKGYPYGLAGVGIAVEARIISVVDAYQSMVSDRPHRSRMNASQALSELQRHAGSQFDPEVVRTFARMLSSQQKAA